MKRWLSKDYTGPYLIPIPVNDDLTQAVSIIIQVMKPNREETTWKVDDIQPHDICHNFTKGELDLSGNYTYTVEVQLTDNEKIIYPEGPTGLVLLVR